MTLPESTPELSGPNPAPASIDTAPPDDVREEIRRVLEADTTALGDVWRRTEAGETPEQIRVARGSERPNFVWNYLRTAKAILEGDLPSAPTVALGAARTLRRILKEAPLSPAAHAVLEQRLEILEGRASDPGARAIEEKTGASEMSGV